MTAIQEIRDKNKIEKHEQSSKHAKKTVTFDAITIDTASFKFDRDEANER